MSIKHANMSSAIIFLLWHAYILGYTWILITWFIFQIHNETFSLTRNKFPKDCSMSVVHASLKRLTSDKIEKEYFSHATAMKFIE